jgi:hypothetical protein
MSTDELVAELEEAFRDEVYPGDLNIIYDNFSWDSEVLRIRENFKVYTWQTVPKELLHNEQFGLPFLSKKGLKYYLPAFLCFAVRDYSGSDAIPDNLVYGLILPTEIDMLVSAFSTRPSRLSTDTALSSLNEEHQARLLTTDVRVHNFINNYGQFNRAQGRAILHFLEHMHDEYGEDFYGKEPEMAIQRYWFQFA